ncbi:hypothetical protein [Spirulina sp. 06S082]|uniref:hypothetical protein n=1 Tax=Spirulina sp. 06S082 TaxID=3110248 RepID=UPI002B20E380|nr:hypothetical protein [Spirulina sp. 06S082]MEA5467999.1 hypothetical protein [Spirulina sp. 06S082]
MEQLTPFNIEQALDDIEAIAKQRNESLRSLDETLIKIHEDLEPALVAATGRFKTTHLQLLRDEIDGCTLKEFGYLGMKSEALSLKRVHSSFTYQDVLVKVFIDRDRLGEFWRITLDSDRDRYCDRGELQETLLQTFAQIRLNALSNKEK